LKCDNTNQNLMVAQAVCKSASNQFQNEAAE
jgi:hypothetical protein